MFSHLETEQRSVLCGGEGGELERDGMRSRKGLWDRHSGSVALRVLGHRKEAA